MTMHATDYRNQTWERIQATLVGRRLQVLLAWRQHGPATTRELAQRSGLDLLMVAPRTTELLTIGLVECCDSKHAHRGGVYRARSDVDARAWFEARRNHPVQGELQLTGGL